MGCRDAVLLTCAGWLALAVPSPLHAGAWVLPEGQTRAELTLMRQRTEQRYFLDGEKIPYFFEGQSRISAAFLKLRRGLWRRLELSVDLSLYQVQFDDLADERSSTGPGDVRLGVRYGILEAPIVVTLGSTVKLPTGDFDNDAEVVPVGEGQHDVELTLELGRSLWPRPGYVTGLFGYRFRAENEASGIDPGNELIWSLEAGYELLPRTTLKLLARGLHGQESTTFGLSVPTLKREAVYLEPALIVSLGETRGVELKVPFTVRGRNWPAGPVFALGFHQTF